MILMQTISDTGTNRFQMRLRSRGANDEIVRETRDTAEIEDNDILSLLIFGQFCALAC